jgi:tetratricopeptide (TPR) repeat protein
MIFWVLPGCNKKKFLDTIPNSDLFVPATLEDFQALLDNESVMNETPTLGELSTDNFYLLQGYWQNLPAKEKNAYIWLSDVFQGQGDVLDWNTPYKQVFHANIILDGLPKVTITNNNEQSWKAIKGAALFARAHAFYNVAQIFAPVYDSRTAATDLGIPVRLHSGVDEVSTRSTLQATYDRIIMDLQESATLLPLNIPLSNNRLRPCKQAAFALLARVYLSMSAFPQAKIYADSCLRLYDSLINYNSPGIPINTPLPFARSNTETLYQSRFLSVTNTVLRGFGSKSSYIDSGLYNSYAVNDLRKQAFFTNGTPPILKGTYTGNFSCFTGLAIDEVYLIRAECQARAGNVTDAMKDLNTLMEKRWRAGFFIPFTAPDAASALAIILEERRKELPFRGLRWTDIRRLNLTEINKITLTRKLDLSYSLPPGDLRYVLFIPPDVISRSGMPQNPR